MLRWASRCLPGFSILMLMFLMLCAFSDSFQIPAWKGIFPPQKGGASTPSTGSGKYAPLNWAQKIFIVYAILVHLNMFAFTCRLAWSIYGMIRNTKLALHRRLTWRSPRSSCDTTPSSSSAASDDGFSPIGSPTKKYPDPTVFQLDDRVGFHTDEPDVVHAIIVPNYCEDTHTLRTTLSVLASHPRAQTQYEVYLAMEQKESAAPEKAAKLAAAFEKSFLGIYTTFHPVGLQGEIAGKSSNVAYAARRIVETHRAELNANTCNVIITVMDADTHLTQDYFLEIRRLHFLHITEAERSFYACPIIFDRNSHETPILVRCADLLWGFAGISTMYPGTPISIPTSVYSLPVALAEKVGGWDSDPTSIGEDMHMLLKCYFETAGNIISRVVHIPASQCNISGDDSLRGWRHTLDTCQARYKQALRHMWGSLDTGFAVRSSAHNMRSKSRRFFFLRLRHIALVHLLWEAHFLPCHLTILLIFSVLYTLTHPVATLHPTLAWMFWVTDLLRTLSLLGMNVNLTLYDRWYSICLNARRQDMLQGNVSDCGYSPRAWWKGKHLAERICFPIAGTLYGAVPTIHAVFSHFWTDRLVYRVSKKPTFTSAATMV